MMNTITDVMAGVMWGTYDAIVGLLAIRRVISEDRNARNANNIMRRIFECICLNGGLFLVSILVFNHLILKWLHFFIQFIFGSQQGIVSTTWFWLEPTLSYFFSVFWVLPLFLLSRVVNALWFQDIADNAFRGRPQNFRNIPIFIADTFFSLLIQVLFLLQSMIVEFLPIPLVGQLASLFHISLLYSLYSFEYKWFNMGLEGLWCDREMSSGTMKSNETRATFLIVRPMVSPYSIMKYIICWELHRRLHFIENNWTYFLGFGLPLALATYMIPNYLLSGAIFSIFFPLFIISANEARPRVGISDIQIRLFSPVVWLSNKILFFVFQFNFLGKRTKS